MAQRAAGFAKKPPTPPQAGSVDRTVRVVASTSALAPIPLKLAPLVAPYKKHGKLSLRVERMPQQARLSAGRNNGNNSWSLTLDELEDLAFLPPDSMEQAPTLAVRIIALDHDGETLAVLDLPVAAEAISPIQAGADSGALAQLQRLHDELARTKAALASREAELARREPGPTEATREKLDAELAAARAAWKSELDERLAAAATQATAQLEKSRNAWEIETSARLSQVEDREQHRRLEARDLWKREAQQVLAEAEASWKVAEEARLALAEKTWRDEVRRSRGGEQLDVEVAALRATLEARDKELVQLRAAQGGAGGEDAQRAQADAAQLRIALTACEGEFAEFRIKAETARSQSDAVAQRLRTEIAQMQATLATRDSETAELRAGVDQVRGQGDIELQRLRAEVSRLQVSLVERDSELTQHKTVAEQVRGRGEAETARLQAEIAQAKDSLAARDREAVQLKISVEQVRSQGDSELTRLRTETAQFQSSLAARDGEIAELKSGIEQSRARGETELQQLRTEIALGKASLATRDGELGQLKTEAEQSRSRSDAELQQLRSEVLQANDSLAAREGEVAQLKTSVEQTRSQGDTERQRLRGEIAQGEALLAIRDHELAQSRLAGEQARSDALRLQQEAVAAARAQWEADEAVRRTATEAAWKDQLTRALAGMRTDGTPVQNDAQAQSLRAEVARLQGMLADRDAAWSKAGAQAQGDTATALASAEAAWKAGEADRLFAAESQWRERLEEATARTARVEAELAQLRAEPVDSQHAAEVQSLHDENAALQQKLAERENVVARLEQGNEVEATRMRAEAQATLLFAESEWKTAEAVRLQKAEVQWREQNATDLAKAVARYQAAEAGQAPQRGRAERNREDVDLVKLRSELVELHAAVAARDNELAYARATLEQRGIKAPGEGQKFKSFEEREQAKRRRAAGGLMLQLAVTAGLVLATFLYYPRIVAMLPQPWQEQITSVTDNVKQAIGQNGTRTAGLAPTPSAAAPHKATITHAANVRVGPSAKSKAVAILKRGAAVAVIEERGAWARVRVDGGQEGWVFGTNLKDIEAAIAPE